MDNNQNNFYGQAEPIKFTKNIFDAIRDPLFLVICILTSVIVALSFDLIYLLLMIGMWMIFAAVKNGNSPLPGAKLCAGTLKALYILCWVAIPFMFVGGATLFIFSPILIAMFESALDNGLGHIIDLESFFEELEQFSDLGISDESLWVIMIIGAGVALMIAAIVLLLFNIFFYKKLYVFAESLRDNISDPTQPILHANTVKTWMLVFAIISGISALGFVFTDQFLLSGTTTANYILLYIWVKKNFAY